MFWLGAAASLCYVPGVTGAYIATQWPFFAVVLSLWLLRGGPFTIFHGAWVAFLAYACLRLPFSPAFDAGVFGLWQVVIMGLALWFGTTLESPRGLYAGLALGASVSSALAVAQHFGLSWPPSTSAGMPGLYVNSVQQGTVLALIAVVLVSERMWFWVLPLLPGLALSQSRGAWLAFGVGLLACKFRRPWVLGAVAVAGLLVYASSALSSSDGQRLLIWKTAWANLSVLGIGPGMMYAMFLPASEWGPFFPEYAHNDSLQIALEYGIGGVFPLAIFAFVLWRTSEREWPVIVAFLTAGCYSMPLFMPITSFLAFVAVGRVLRAYAVAGGYRSGSGFAFISLRWFDFGAMRGTLVPVQSNSATKGVLKW